MARKESTKMNKAILRPVNTEYYRPHKTGDVLCQVPLSLIAIPPVWKKERYDWALQLTKSSSCICLNQPVVSGRPSYPEVNNSKYDMIYFDIWPTMSGDNWPDMCRLHRRFGRYLNRNNKKAFIDSWCREECRKRYRVDISELRSTINKRKPCYTLEHAISSTLFLIT